MPDRPTIIRGLPAGQEAAAAALYWEAFRGKLAKTLGPDARGQAFFTATVNRDRVIAALDETGTLLGIAAFKINGQGFSSAGLASLWRHYGIGALWRMIPLMMLERDAPADTLQMDGICVAASVRGRGVGQALLTDLFAFARDQGFAKITLDVIDSNPRARALYERLGFQAGATSETGPLGHILGFKQATKMTRRL